MNPVDRAHAYIDRFMAHVAKSAAAKGRPASCKGPGCFWCCKEPVYAEREEAKHIVSQLTPAARTALVPKVQAWWDKFFSSGLCEMPHPDEIKGKGWMIRYRAQNLWCPMLKDGKCSDYERRPASCRYHIASGSPKRCEDDHLRLKQHFITTDQHGNANATALGMLCQSAPTALFEFDHLGIWLGHLLLGKTERSAGAQNILLRQTDPQPV